MTGFDAVANLQPAGLFIEEDANKKPVKLHVFARARNAPHQFHYRPYDISAGYWYPWQPVAPDIASYDVETEDRTTGKTFLGENGAYLIPVRFNNRLLVFFPQFRRKTAATPQDRRTFKGIGDADANKRQNIQGWEIAMPGANCATANGHPSSWPPGPSPTTPPRRGSGRLVPPDISQYRIRPAYRSDRDGAPRSPSIATAHPPSSAIGDTSH